jgi:hypothetical protein
MQAAIYRLRHPFTWAVDSSGLLSQDFAIKMPLKTAKNKATSWTA